VREPFRQLEREGFRVSWLKPGPGGLVDPADLAQALRPDTQLVSLMHVNNETGVIQDIAALGALCREHGALFHVDAAQSAGRLALDLARLPVDLLTLSAHKIYGPKGVGALYLHAATVPWLAPLMHGGGQERGLRPGTVATHQVAGMGVACRLAAARMAEDAARLRALRDALWDGLREIPDVLLNGDPERRASHILNVSVAGVCGESLLFALAGELALSAGAACSSDTGEPSPVLRSLGRSRQLAESSLRFSLGRQTTTADIALAVGAVGRAVAALRRMRPLAAGPAA
jgi:cysteine desulfurase